MAAKNGLPDDRHHEVSEVSSASHRSPPLSAAACLVALLLLTPAGMAADQPHSNTQPTDSATMVELDGSLVELGSPDPLFPRVPEDLAASDAEDLTSQLIPEPSTVALAGLAGMFGLAGFLRSRWG